MINDSFENREKRTARLSLKILLLQPRMLAIECSFIAQVDFYYTQRVYTMELIHLDRTQYPSILKSIESSSTFVTINLPARLIFVRQRTCEGKSLYHLILGFKYEMLEGTASEKLLFKILLCTIYYFVRTRLIESN